MSKPLREVAAGDTLIFKSCPLVKVFLGDGPGNLGEPGPGCERDYIVINQVSTLTKSSLASKKIVTTRQRPEGPWAEKPSLLSVGRFGVRSIFVRSLTGDSFTVTRVAYLRPCRFVNAGCGGFDCRSDTSMDVLPNFSILFILLVVKSRKSRPRLCGLRPRLGPRGAR